MIPLSKRKCMAVFLSPRMGKISMSWNIEFSKSRSIFQILAKIFGCQLGVFMWGLRNPPSRQQNLKPISGRVNQMQSIHAYKPDNWHERSGLGSRQAMTLVSIKNFIIFHFFSFLHFLRPFLIEVGLRSKNLLSESWREHPKPRGYYVSRPSRPLVGPLAAISDCAGGAELQAVSECPPCG